MDIKQNENRDFSDGKQNSKSEPDAGYSEIYGWMQNIVTALIIVVPLLHFLFVA